MPRTTEPVKRVCYADDLTVWATGVQIPDLEDSINSYLEEIIAYLKDKKKNILLDGLPHPINDSEKDLTRKERTTLAQLRSGYCKVLGSYKSRIKKDVKHLFAFPAHPTTLIPSDLWSKPVEYIREFSYLEEET